MSKMTEVKNPLAMHPKMDVGENYLRLAANITDADLRVIVAGLHRMESSRMWIWGDFLNEVERLRPYNTRRPDTDGARRHSELVALIMGAAGAEAQTLAHARRVCRFYPQECRVRGASYSHHKVAFEEVGGGGLDEALDWLQRVVREGWSISGMRAHIRKAQGRAKPEAKDRVQRLYELIPVCRQIPIASLTREQRQQLKEDARPFVEWWQQL